MPRGKTRTRSTSKARLGSSTSGKTSTILSSMSPGKASSKRQTVCTEKNGKVMCQTVDKQTRAISPAGKRRLARKQARCAVAEELGVGQCDQDGDLWYNEDMIPEHTEIDENGNVVRMLYVDPKYIAFFKDGGDDAFRMIGKLDLDQLLEEVIDNVDPSVEGGFNKETLAKAENYKMLQTIINSLGKVSLQRVNPDRLKQAYITTKDEIRHKKMLFQYLVCLANQDATSDEVNNELGAYYGSDFRSFSKRMMEMQILRRVMSAVENARLSGQTYSPGRLLADASGRVAFAGFSFETDSQFNFKRVTWEYNNAKDSVSVKLPEELSAALREKFLFNELLKSNDNDIGGWIAQLVKGDVINGATMSKDLIGMILLYTSAGPDVLGISTYEGDCAIAFASEKRATATITTDDNSKITSFTGRNGNNLLPLARPSGAFLNNPAMNVGEAARRVAIAEQRLADANAIVVPDGDEAARASKDQRIAAANAQLEAARAELALARGEADRARASRASREIRE